MVIGTFWSEAGNCWVRFNVEKGNAVKAEIAVALQNHPYFTGEWQAAPNQGQIWSVNFKSDSPAKHTMGYQIVEGKLYKTDGKDTGPTKAIVVSVCDDNGQWGPNKNHGIKPLEGYKPVDIQKNHNDLPLNHDDQLAKWKVLQDAGIYREKFIGNNANTTIEFMNAILACEHIVDENDIALLYSDLNQELMGFSPFYNLTPLDYLIALEKVIEDTTDVLNERIRALASKTVTFDEALNLNPTKSSDIQQQLYGLKIAFYFNLLKDEANSIRECFKMPKKELVIVACQAAGPEQIRQAAAPRNNNNNYMANFDPRDYVADNIGDNDNRDDDDDDDENQPLVPNVQAAPIHHANNDFAFFNQHEKEDEDEQANNNVNHGDNNFNAADYVDDADFDPSLYK